MFFQNKQLFVKHLVGLVLKNMGDLNYSPGELLVVNYHSTPEKFIPSFTRQIQWFRKRFDILDPADLAKYFIGEVDQVRCKLLITFDDGLKNNLRAAETLNNLGFHAMFFIVPEFINTPRTEQKAYYIKNIRPAIDPRVDAQSEDFEAMDWEDIKKLVSQGHVIGSHTCTHTMHAGENDSSAWQREIVLSKELITEKTGQTITSFCSINNTLLSVNSEQKKLIGEHYRFHFTTLPGSNKDNRDPLFIKRRNIECHWPKGAVCFALGKRDLGRWNERVKSFENL